MGLKFPDDLNQWRTWAEKQNFLRYAKNRLKKIKRAQLITPQKFTLSVLGEGAPSVLVALEAPTPTQIASLIQPAIHLHAAGEAVAVLAPIGAEETLNKYGFRAVGEQNSLEPPVHLLDDVRQVIAVGHYLPAGGWAYEQARQKNWEFNVIQHGLNTPFAPPLPANSTLFAFSQADAEFWISGRTDITYEVVGSQLFYRAQNTPQVSAEEIENTPIFLGQMHGAELPRTSFAQAGYRFSKNHATIYRPHPSEKDKLSLMTHKLWARLGITIDRSATPLNQLNNPVVSVFSTGVLEAAMRGIPAWVYHPNPPSWLLEFWDRYGMRQWGNEPTPAPSVPAVEPALAIAQKIAEKLEK